VKIHIIKQGDTLYHLAKKYHVTVDELLKHNPGIKDPHQLQIGTKIRIPSSNSGSGHHGGGTSIGFEIIHQHTVKSGDTMWKLSQEWGVPLSDLLAANKHIKNPNVLMVGEVVNIPKGVSVQLPTGLSPQIQIEDLSSIGLYPQIHIEDLFSASGVQTNATQILPGAKTHTVVAGDTLYKLSKQYGVALNDIIAFNPNIKNPNVLDIGMKVFIPTVTTGTGGGGHHTSPVIEIDTKHQYKVQSGDTMWNLSKHWNIPMLELIEANKHIAKPELLHVGDIINIPSSYILEIPVPFHTTQQTTTAHSPQSKKNTGVKPSNEKKNTAVQVNTPPKPVAPVQSNAPEQIVKPAPAVQPIIVTKPKEIVKEINIEFVSQKPVVKPAKANENMIPQMVKVESLPNTKVMPQTTKVKPVENTKMTTKVMPQVVKIESANTKLAPQAVKVESANTKLMPQAVKVESANTKLMPQAVKVESANTKLMPQAVKVESANTKLMPQAVKVESANTKLMPQAVKVQSANTKLMPQAVKVESANTKLMPQAVKVESANTKLMPQAVKVESANTKLMPQAVKVESANTKLMPQAVKIESANTKLMPQATKVQPANTKIVPQAVKVESANTKLMPQAVKVQPANTKLMPQAVKVESANTKLMPQAVKVQPANTKIVPQAVKIESANTKLMTQATKIEPVANAKVAEKTNKIYSGYKPLPNESQQPVYMPNTDMLHQYENYKGNVPLAANSKVKPVTNQMYQQANPNYPIYPTAPMYYQCGCPIYPNTANWGYVQPMNYANNSNQTMGTVTAQSAMYPPPTVPMNNYYAPWGSDCGCGGTPVANENVAIGKAGKVVSNTKVKKAAKKVTIQSTPQSTKSNATKSASNKPWLNV